MIEFKIIAAADRAQMGSYQHLGREITMGQSEGEMLIDDPQLAPLQLRVRADGPGFIVENLNPKVELRLNGKAIQGSAPLRERDTIVLGKTTISFTRLDSSESAPMPPPFEHPNSATRFAPGTKEKAIQDALEILSAGTAKPPTPAKPPLPPRK